MGKFSFSANDLGQMGNFVVAFKTFYVYKPFVTYWWVCGAQTWVYLHSNDVLFFLFFLTMAMAKESYSLFDAKKWIRAVAKGDSMLFISQINVSTGSFLRQPYDSGFDPLLCRDFNTSLSFFFFSIKLPQFFILTRSIKWVPASGWSKTALD